MRAELEQRDTGYMIMRVVLSERNVRTLVAKLEGHPPDSACTIVKETGAGLLIVKVEPDAEHYADRPEGPAGPMHPDTEAALTYTPAESRAALGDLTAALEAQRGRERRL